MRAYSEKLVVWHHTETGRLFASESAYAAGSAPIGRVLSIIPLRGWYSVGMTRRNVHQVRAHTFADDRVWSGRSSGGGATITLYPLIPEKGKGNGGTVYNRCRELVRMGGRDG